MDEGQGSDLEEEKEKGEGQVVAREAGETRGGWDGGEREGEVRVVQVLRHGAFWIAFRLSP